MLRKNGSIQGSHKVLSLRGVRGRKSGSGMKDLANVNFDFVPEGESYESY